MTSADDLPDECACGADFTIDRRTDIDRLHKARKVEHIAHHYRTEHPIIWRISHTATRIAILWKQLRRKLKP